MAAFSSSKGYLTADAAPRAEGTPREAPREASGKPLPIFTASEIAAATGKTKRAVLQQLAGLPADGVKKPARGPAAQGWSPESLPSPLFAELECKCGLPDGTRRFRTVADLLSHGAPAIQNGRAPASDYTDDDRALAGLKAEVLAPLLFKRAREHTPLAPLARRARAAFASPLRGRMPSLRTIEEWLRTAERRDNGRGAFQRAELYLPEAPSHGGPDAAAPGVLLFPRIEAFIAECSGPLPRKHRPLLWHAAFCDYECAIADGMTEAAARRAAIERLAHHTSPLYPATAEALLRAWNVKLPIWCDGGRTDAALADLRETNSGRPSRFALTRDESLALRNLVLKKDSVDLAIEFFPQSPACTPQTRALIHERLDTAARTRRRPQWPQSLRRAAHVTAEERALFRGEKAFQSVEGSVRRGHFYIDEHGKEQPLAPNTIWESDDMSTNEPFRHTDPETGVIRLGRQTLFTLDVQTGFWLGCDAIARERDAYRAEDIANHIEWLVKTHGLPLVWRIERGVWDNTFIHGKEVDGPSGKQRWGGLGDIIRIEQTYKSNGKGTVEGGFNFLQRLTAHNSTSIGRKRGEFEEGMRLFLAAQKGDAEAAGRFWTIEEYADAMRAAMDHANRRPKTRRALGRDMSVAADLYQHAQRRECPPEQLWRFLPVKKPATVRRGAVECSVKHYPHPFRFTINGAAEGIYLEHGHKILIAFHPGRPDEGCHIFNAEFGARNRHGWRFGELLFVAPLAPDSSQFSLSRDEQRATARKAAAAAVRTEFRSVAKAGAPAISRSEARDGYGNRIEKGTPRTPSGEHLQTRNRGAAAADPLIAAALARLREPDDPADLDAYYRDINAKLDAEEAERRRTALPS